MARFIITLVLLIALVTIALWEQDFIGNTYTKLETDLEALSSAMMTQTDDEIKDPANGNIAKVNQMYDYWTKKEKYLSLVARHFDLAQISDALIYVKNFVEFGNKEEAFAGIQRLRYLIDAHKHNFGTSLPNVV